MKFIADRATLAAAIKRAGAIATRSTIPILGHVLLTAERGKVVLQATDLERWHTETVSADVQAPGQCAPHAALLGQVLQVGGDAASLIANERLTVTVGKSKSVLALLPAEDFPVVPELRSPVRFEIGGTALADAISKVERAVCKEPSRPAICGLHLSKRKAGLRFATTNGHLLMALTMDLSAPDFPECIIPDAALPHIKRLAAAESVTAEIGEGAAQFTAGQLTFRTLLVAHTFPDIDRVTPSDGKVSVAFDPEHLIAGIAAVRPVAATIKGSSAVTLHLNGANVASLTSSGADGQTAETEVEVGDREGADLSVSFNATYLTDMAEAADADTLTLTTNDAMSPARFANPANPNWVGVLMPMRR